MSLIELQEIEKVYGKGEARVRALNKVNLTIEEGEFVAIVGKSGSGKSTLLNILGAIDSPTKGNYLLEGKNVSNLNKKQLACLRNKHFGFVLQYFGLIKDYTVYENVALPLEYRDKKIRNKKDKVLELLKYLSIEDKVHKYPTELSGGQNQRVAIARALINDPKIILADEPTGALDKETSEDILQLLQSLNEKGTTIIVVTHDESISKRCSRTIRIEDGKIMEEM